MGVSGYEACGGTSFYYWARSDANIIRDWVSIARVHTDNQLSNFFYWSNSEETEMEFVANVGYRGALATVGYGHSQVRTNGVTYSAGPYYWIDYLADWDFRAYNLYCGSGASPSYSYSGIYEWRPYVWTGGSSYKNATGTLFSCTSSRTAQISYETWATRSSVVFWTNSFSIGGVGGRSRQTSTSEHKLTWRPSSATWWCGNNNYPIYAALAREA